MGQFATKKLVRIQSDSKKLDELELNIDSKFSNTRKKLTNVIDFPFVFLDEENNEIFPKDELSNTLNNILEGKNLYFKRRIKQRKILGDKIDTINNLDIYLYPNINIDDLEEKNCFNIMVIEKLE